MCEPVVAVLGGNRIIGGILETSLQMAGCDARFLAGTESGELGDLLSDVRLVILPPLLGTERREAYLEGIAATPAAAVPLLELVRDGEEPKSLAGNFVPWPCSLEVLEREVKAAIPRCESG
jgi:hypothetical protein